MRIFDVGTSNTGLNESTPGATLIAILGNLSERRFLLFSPFVFVSALALLVLLTKPGISAAQHVVRVRSKTSIDLTTSETRPPGIIAGTLRDSLGVPLQNQRIEVVATYSTDRRVRNAVNTRRDGGFTAPFDATSQDCRVWARFDGNAFYEASEATLDSMGIDSIGRHRGTPPENAVTDRGSLLEEGQMKASEPLSVFWLLIPMVLCLGVVFGTRRRIRNPNPKVEREIESSLNPGIKISAPIRYARKDRTSISGTIRDLNNGDALSDVELILFSELNTAVRVDITSEGYFSSPSLSPGKWRIQARANGYVETTKEFVIPHRGEWTNVQIHLLSMRSLALQSYRKVALALLPMPQLWDIWTARETLNNSRRLLGSPALFESLVERVERSSYCRNPPSREEVRSIETQASSALREMPRGESDYTVAHRR